MSDAKISAIPNPIRDQLHGIARNSTSAVINTELFFDTDIIRASKLFCGDNLRSGYFDVPIRNIRAISRADFRGTGHETWGRLAQRLICPSWGPEIFTYFEADLLDTKFPVDDSGAALEIQIYGSLAYCSCGNHRIAACIVYLADKYKDDRLLKKAKGTYYPLSKHRLKLVQQLLTPDTTKIFLLDSPSPVRPYYFPVNGHILKVHSGESIKIYHLTQTLVEILKDESPMVGARLKQWIKSKGSAYRALDFPHEQRADALTLGEWEAACDELDSPNHNKYHWVELQIDILKYWFAHDL